MAKESKEDTLDMVEIESVSEMPKPKRGIQGTSESVNQLMEKIGDLKAHRLVGVSTESKVQWGRKLRYAAKLADLELETVFVNEDTSDGKPAGLYFRGYKKGEGPKRGRRT